MRTSPLSTDHSTPKILSRHRQPQLQCHFHLHQPQHHNHGETNRRRRPNCQAHRRSRPSQPQSARRPCPRKQGSKVNGLLQGTFRQGLQSKMRSNTYFNVHVLTTVGIQRSNSKLRRRNPHPLPSRRPPRSLIPLRRAHAPDLVAAPECRRGADGQEGQEKGCQ